MGRREAFGATAIAAVFLVAAVLNHQQDAAGGWSAGPAALEQESLFVEGSVGQSSVMRDSKVAQAVLKFEDKYKAVMGKGDAAALDSTLASRLQRPTAQLSVEGGGAATTAAPGGGKVLRDLLGGAGKALEKKFDSERANFERERSEKDQAVKSLGEVETQLLPQSSSKADQLAKTMAEIGQREKRLEERIVLKKEHPEQYASLMKKREEEKEAEKSAAAAAAAAAKAAAKAAAAAKAEKAAKPHSSATAEKAATTEPKAAAKKMPAAAAAVEAVLHKYADNKADAKVEAAPAKAMSSKSPKDAIVQEKAREAAGGRTDGQLAAAEAVAMQSKTPSIKEREEAVAKQQHAAKGDAPEDKKTEQARRAAGGGVEGVDGQLAAAENVAHATVSAKKAPIQTLKVEHEKAPAKAAKPAASASASASARAPAKSGAAATVDKKTTAEAKKGSKEINPLSVIDKALTVEAAAKQEAKVHAAAEVTLKAKAKAEEKLEEQAKAKAAKAKQQEEDAEASAVASLAKEDTKDSHKPSAAAKHAPAAAAAAAAAAKPAAHAKGGDGHKEVAHAEKGGGDSSKGGGDSSPLDEITMAMHKEAVREKAVKAKAKAVASAPPNPEEKRLAHLFGGKVGSKIEKLFTKMKKSKAAAEALAKKGDTKADLMKPLPMPLQIKKEAAEKAAKAAGGATSSPSHAAAQPKITGEKKLGGDDKDMDKIALKDLHAEEGKDRRAKAESEVRHDGDDAADGTSQHRHSFESRDSKALLDLRALQKQGLMPRHAPATSPTEQKEAVDGGDKAGRDGKLPRLMQHLFGKKVNKFDAKVNEETKSGVPKIGPKIIHPPKMSAEDLEADKDLKMLQKHPKLGLLGGPPQGGTQEQARASPSSGDDDLGAEGTF